MRPKRTERHCSNVKLTTAALAEAMQFAHNWKFQHLFFPYPVRMSLRDNQNKDKTVTVLD